MADDRRKKLVQLLISKTQEGALNWQPTASDSTYKVSFARSTVLLSEHFNEDSNGSDFRISLLNQNGVTAESFDDTMLDSDEVSGLPWFKTMTELFGLARRKALGSDKILDDIIDALDTPF